MTDPFSVLRDARTIAVVRRPRRQQPIAKSNIAAAQRNGSCPSSSPSTNAGFTSTAAAHQPRRSSGKAQNVATTRPTKPMPRVSVTLHSLMSGQSSTANIQGMNPYGKASAWPWARTGMRNGKPPPCQKRSATNHTWM